MLFTINAIFSIVKYKITHFKETIMGSLRRPISFKSDISSNNVIQNTINNVQNIVNNNQPFVFREPLPELPAEA